MLKCTYDILFKLDKEPKQGDPRVTSSGIEYLKL